MKVINKFLLVFAIYFCMEWQGIAANCPPGVSINTETVALKPTPRTRTKIGVCEQVKLTLNPSPSSTVTWSITGQGTLSATTGNPVTFTAHDRASTPKVTASYDGYTCEISFNVVEPSGAYQVQYGSTIHIYNTASAGFKGITYLTPKDVSFEYIEINEGTCTASGTGCWAGTASVHNPWPSWASVSTGDNTKGCMVQGPNQTGSTYWDFVFSSRGSGPWSAGTFTWVIPWEFRKPGGSKKQFTTLTHYAVYEANGKVTMSKGGVSVSAVPSDATVTP